ncbi:MAG: 16S rRNA (adenine(1518)-N(6)/adenine(1519)-N(6))-dimethyltransferase RsmA [Planctomycetes bacterium]|nr:16S rRNA (adenine(1518)-N(6)/adenine(1519)-N(6))-dimethyltransferase RsmA [Planctomycetota bacterium]
MPLPRTLTEIKEILDSRGLLANTRKLGQHFLFDKNLLNFIVNAAALTPDDVVLEVGPGPGMLTGVLLDSGAKVIAVELDEGFASFVEENADSSRIKVIRADVLDGKAALNPVVVRECENALARSEVSRLKVVANIPYNISTSLIVNLLESELPLERFVLTVQKEVAQRIVATSGGKYGIISVVTALLGKPKLLKKLGRDVFWPRPKVESAVLEISNLRVKPSDVAGYGLLKDLLHLAFSHRRKTLHKALKGAYRAESIERAFKMLAIDSNARAEELSPETLLALSRNLLTAKIEH